MPDRERERADGATDIDVVLYTRESARSSEKAEEEKKVKDPARGRAMATLTGEAGEGKVESGGD